MDKRRPIHIAGAGPSGARLWAKALSSRDSPDYSKPHTLIGPSLEAGLIPLP